MGKAKKYFCSYEMPKTYSANCVEGFSFGLNKGFVVSQNVKRRPRKTSRRRAERVNLITSTVKAVAGFAPYEKRVIEMYKVGNPKLDKRANRFLRKRLGNIKRGKRKSEELLEMLKK